MSDIAAIDLREPLEKELNQLIHQLIGVAFDECAFKACFNIPAYNADTKFLIEQVNLLQFYWDDLSVEEIDNRINRIYVILTPYLHGSGPLPI